MVNALKATGLEWCFERGTRRRWNSPLTGIRGLPLETWQRGVLQLFAAVSTHFHRKQLPPYNSFAHVFFVDNSSLGNSQVRLARCVGGWKHSSYNSAVNLKKKSQKKFVKFYLKVLISQAEIDVLLFLLIFHQTFCEKRWIFKFYMNVSATWFFPWLTQEHQ